MTREEIICNLVIGVTGSIIASIIVLTWTQRKDKEKIKLKFSGPAGIYLGYGFTVSGGSEINPEKPISEVKIQYLSENRLSLTLKELNHPHQWSGIIAMETENYGAISWRYDILNGKSLDLKTHRFGFKRLILMTRENKKVVYLIGENGYNEEVLIEVK